ncbi:helix-turn-helix transcriptional regulator [Shewanella sp. Isolate11]|uniref:helix-turn-helix domain-containing protein n=1 Tax=Shewanella sp. Isolate11 TaxID=2908530 RepID=UPI001EFD237E|nr:helix-turn-helix transcriptional regulator [Shewanella sp. Isolate11]MCG9697442.1 helix-turn-helix domain-containing protein [Shewanella sp. Isolate11]
MAKRGADLLKTGRRLRGFTQDEVAQTYGVSTKTYRNWERGNTPVSFDDLHAICDQVFQVSIDFVREVCDAGM